MDLTAGLDWAAIAGLTGTALLIELTPGPNMACLAIVAATDGRRAGHAAVAGVARGLALVWLAAAPGLAAAINASPLLHQALRWAGVACLLWLAWQGWRGADKVVDPAACGSTPGRFFTCGLVANLRNPKAAVFHVTMLPGFVAPLVPVMPQTLALSATFVAVAGTVHAGIVTLAGTAREILGHPGRIRLAQRALALALAAVAVWFALRT